MKLSHLEWSNQASPYLRQHRQGFRDLSFAPELEHAFRQYYANTFVVRMRWALLVAVVLGLLFIVLDASNLPEPLRGQVLTLRMGFIQPLLIMTWLATYRRGLRNHLQRIVGLAMLLSAFGVVGVIALARHHAYPLPYEGIILVTVYFYFLAGLRFTSAVLCGWLIFAAYLLVELNGGLATRVVIDSVLFLALANLIGGVGGYFLEYAARENFIVQGLLKELAEKDSLTGLLNRRAFTERAERSWRQALREHQALGVVMLDVDFFKRYNDHYGHAAGDEALRQVAQVLAEHAQRPLDCVARYGGEEFVGLWYGLNEEQMRGILEKLRRAVEALNIQHDYSDVAPVVTLSIGLAYLTPEPSQSLDAAVHLADLALYLAKAQGRNRVVAKTRSGWAAEPSLDFIDRA